MRNNDMTIKRRFDICLRVLQIALRVRPRAVIGFFAGAGLEIVSMVVSIYATAKLGSLLATFVATGQTDYIWFWLTIDIVSLGTTGLGFLAMQYARRIIYFSFVRWNINSFLGAISELDLQSY